MADTLTALVVTASSTKGAGAVHVIKQALQAPGVFVFGELLDAPSVAELATNPDYADHKKWHDLLCIFAHGTYHDYKEKKDYLPELGKAELHKLKELTTLTMASKRRVLPYDSLLKSLDISDVRELEDLMIDAITHGLLHAKLDQQSRVVEVLDTMGRDLRPDDLDTMLGVLNQWVADSQSVLDTLTQMETTSVQEMERRAESRKRLEECAEKNKVVIKRELAEAELNAAKAGQYHGLTHMYQDQQDMGFGFDDVEDDYRRPTTAGRRKRGFGAERNAGSRTGSGL